MVPRFSRDDLEDMEYARLSNQMNHSTEFDGPIIDQQIITKENYLRLMTKWSQVASLFSQSKPEVSTDA